MPPGARQWRPSAHGGRFSSRPRRSRVEHARCCAPSSTMATGACTRAACRTQQAGQVEPGARRRSRDARRRRLGRAASSCERLSDSRSPSSGRVRIPSVERWWPHTHGPQPLYGSVRTVDRCRRRRDETWTSAATGSGPGGGARYQMARASAWSSTALRCSAAASAGRHSISPASAADRPPIAPRSSNCATPA